MNNKRYQIAGTLTAVVFAFCVTSLFAAEVGSDAGVEKETVLSLIKKGGPIMIFLGLASLLAMALGLERLIALSKGRVMPEKFIGGLKEAWNNDPSGSEALAFCDESGGTVGHVFKAGIRRVNMGRDAVEKAIDDVGSREADKMKRSLRPLRNIAMVSPLLGLLGTVYGMIDAFQKTSQSGGTASTAMLATGIYEALVTTAAGLTIAIPVLLFYQFLLGRVDQLIDDIDEAGAEFVFSCADGNIARPDTNDESVEGDDKSEKGVKKKKPKAVNQDKGKGNAEEDV